MSEIDYQTKYYEWRECVIKTCEMLDYPVNPDAYDIGLASALMLAIDKVRLPQIVSDNFKVAALIEENERLRALLDKAWNSAIAPLGANCEIKPNAELEALAMEIYQELKKGE